MPAATIHRFKGFDIQEGAGDPANTNRFGSLRSPHNLYACSDIGMYSTPFVFFWVKFSLYVSFIFCTSDHFSFWMSQCLNPVNAENNAALLIIGLSHGVVASMFSSSVVRNSRLLYNSCMLLLLTAISMVR